MKYLLAAPMVTFCGVVTSVLTAAIVFAIHQLTGVNVFTYTLSFIIPIGAILTGMLSVSGYYFAARHFNTKPGVGFFVQMILVGVATQVLIYWSEYTAYMRDLSAIEASEGVRFFEYLTTSLTEARYQVGRRLDDTVVVGQYGYALAIMQLIGFVLGAVAVYIVLRRQPMCQSCNVYMKPRVKKRHIFANEDDFWLYYNNIRDLDTRSTLFADMVKVSHTSKVYNGSYRLDDTLYACPDCSQQLIQHLVAVRKRDFWTPLPPLKRQVYLPRGENLENVYKATDKP